jgi:hypothetical protein
MHLQYVKELNTPLHSVYLVYLLPCSYLHRSGFFGVFRLGNNHDKVYVPTPVGKSP